MEGAVNSSRGTRAFRSGLWNIRSIARLRKLELPAIRRRGDDLMRL